MITAESVELCVIQAAAIPPILKGGDVVVAAETGSGKTQAYLAPLFHKLWKRNHKPDDLQQHVKNQTAGKLRDFALVLCPNAILCEQVAQMASIFHDYLGVPILKVAVLCGGQVSTCSIKTVLLI